MSNYDDFSGMDDNMFEGMSEIDQIEAENKLMYKAFNNSYNIITKKTTFIKMLDDDIDGVTAIAHNLDTGFTSSDLENMIEYSIEFEEYEKCAVLHALLKEGKYGN